MSATRVDKWLWAVRVYKTRGAATEACRGGHVRVNGASAKPATPVTVGDRVEATGPRGKRVLEVVEVIDKRVGAPVAVTCYHDRTPPPTPQEQGGTLFARERGAGRPTKRDRRQLDRFRAGR
ncbi:MAG TPA: RNA-binding S4 domain-containing protein [Acidimicrobiales bacterium]